MRARVPRRSSRISLINYRGKTWRRLDLTDEGLISICHLRHHHTSEDELSGKGCMHVNQDGRLGFR